MRRVGLLIFLYFILNTSYIIRVDSVFAQSAIPLYGLFETEVINNNSYSNPFDYSEIELSTTFAAPSGAQTNFYGFYDGDGTGGQSGNVWKLRFMPDEVGTWNYTYSWTGSSPSKPSGGSGSFTVNDTGLPGLLKPDEENSIWFKTQRGDHFFPISYHANAPHTRIDWIDAINWGEQKGFNMLVSATIDSKTWGDGWENPTMFETVNTSTKTVDYTTLNLRQWHEWDDMIETAGAAGIIIVPFDGPSGDYGGQSGSGTVYPPDDLAYFPKMLVDYNHPVNLNIMKYMVARQGAYWNLAAWNLYSTEIYEIKTREEVIAYGEHIALLDPFERMITVQDVEQYESGDFNETNRNWLRDMNIPDSRKLNTVQIGNYQQTWAQEAGPNNAAALDLYSRGYPVIDTEGLWEGQPRAMQPLRMIWGGLTGGMHTMWADWSYESGVDGHKYGSIGRGWIPVIPTDEHVFQVDQLGVDTIGDEQLVIAGNAIESEFEYWLMTPHNEAATGVESYTLAELGRQYIVYLPNGDERNGGTVNVDLSSTPGTFEAKWLDPRVGGYSVSQFVSGNQSQSFTAPDSQDWVLFLKETSGVTITPTPIPPGQIISNISPSNYIIQTNLQVGIDKYAYIDRDFTYSSIPNYLQRANYIQTANDDKNSSEDGFLTFNIAQNASVYIAYDSRIPTIPSWLGSFTKQTEQLNTTDTSFDIYKKDFQTGSVSLGGNEGGTASMYTVIVVPSSSSKPGDTDNDGDVDISDLSTLLATFGSTGSGLSADFDQDQDVDISDLSTLLANFGQ